MPFPTPKRIASFRLCLAVVLLCQFAVVATAQKPLLRIVRPSITCLTYATALLYKGEVDDYGKPDGVGTCLFDDSACYVGQFTDGAITGEGVFLVRKGTPTVKVAQWVNGQVSGQYFTAFPKHLNMRQTSGTTSYPLRNSSYSGNYLSALQYNGNDIASTKMTCFLLNTKEFNDANVFFSGADSTYNIDGLYADYATSDMNIHLRTLVNGVYGGDYSAQGEASTYRFLDTDADAKLAVVLKHNVPAWLTGADYFVRDDTQDKFFGSQPAVGSEEGSYSSQYGSSGTDFAYLRVSPLSKWFLPFGFIQEVFHPTPELYRFSFGNLQLDDYANGIGEHRGNGIVMNCTATGDSSYFEVLAGNIHELKRAGTGDGLDLHSGFFVQHSGNDFFVTLGDWDDDNRLGNGYFVNLTSAGYAFFRGALNKNAPDGAGELITGGDSETNVVISNGVPTVLQHEIPPFAGISPPSLFAQLFDVEMK